MDGNKSKNDKATRASSNIPHNLGSTLEEYFIYSDHKMGVCLVFVNTTLLELVYICIASVDIAGYSLLRNVLWM